MSTYATVVIVLIIFLSIVIYILSSSFSTRYFDKYFEVSLDESYNLDHLFPIKIDGTIIPKVSFLEIPYNELNIEINKKTIRGTIVNNIINLELIKTKDRKKSIHLIKEHYIRAVKPYITEIVRDKKEYIELIKISEKQKQYIEKIACQTCKNKMQCQIAFTECNYERKFSDQVLNKGMKVDSDRNYKFDNING